MVESWTSDGLLDALTTLVEQEDVFLGKRVLLREITGLQRQNAYHAAVAENPNEIDNAMYRACVIQAGTLHPDTKQPLFSLSAIPRLAQGRHKLTDDLAAKILNLSEALPEHLKSGGVTHDHGQPDTGDRAETAEQDGGRFDDRGTGTPNERGVYVLESLQSIGPPVYADVGADGE